MTTQPVVTVDHAGLVLTEPVLGVGRYAAGDLILFTIRHATWSNLPPAPYAYRLRVPHPHLPGGWLPVWGDPSKIREFVTSNPVGTIGKVSNRRIEVVDYGTVIPSGSITVPANGVGGEMWNRW